MIRSDIQMMCSSPSSGKRVRTRHSGATFVRDSKRAYQNLNRTTIHGIEAFMNTPHYFGTPSPMFSSRRDFLLRAGGGFGVVALAQLLGREGWLSTESSASELNALNPLAARQSHFTAKAKSVIWLFINGGPSQAAT